jgi:hypothetical protein
VARLRRGVNGQPTPGNLPRLLTDPLKDTTALIAQVRAGFVPQPEAAGAFGYDFRAAVEMNRCRRLAKDWENLSRTAVAFLRLASVRLMMRKLCQT